MLVVGLERREDLARPAEVTQARRARRELFHGPHARRTRADTSTKNAQRRTSYATAEAGCWGFPSVERLAFSLTLTLYVIPAVYAFLSRQHSIKSEEEIMKDMPVLVENTEGGVLVQH